MKTKIRRFRQDDIPFVQQLMHELGYPIHEEEVRFNIDQIHRRNGIVVVAESGGKVVGCLSALINAGLAEGMFGEIVSLVVSKEYRGAGIGRRLVTQAEEWLKPQVGKIRVRANSIRQDAHRFYKSLGYKEIKTQVSFIKYV
ncbi:MAG: GNAT family N-acetyltransferase [Desulfobacterales bacterium]|nr:GNAT family N-acetyltransferase [Desulfobacterales bacterium]